MIYAAVEAVTPAETDPETIKRVKQKWVFQRRGGEDCGYYLVDQIFCKCVSALCTHGMYVRLM